MDFIRLGTLHYTIPDQPLPLVDEHGKPMTVAENWEACEQDYIEACARNREEKQRRRLGRDTADEMQAKEVARLTAKIQRGRVRNRLASMLACFGRR